MYTFGVHTTSHALNDLGAQQNIYASDTRFVLLRQKFIDGNQPIKLPHSNLLNDNGVKFVDGSLYQSVDFVK